MAEVHQADEIYAGDRYVVYRIRASEGGRPVVVKTLARGRDDAGCAARLRREYELLTTLDVPGVVKPLRIEDRDGMPALLLESAGTLDLGVRLRLGPVGVPEFLDLAVQMAAAVGHVHSRNVVHRDLSPAKFVLDERQRVTLVGFEFATALSAHARCEPEGTLAYMAPEQTGRMRRAVDHRADLYALGATFYEMLVGSPPFAALAPAALVHAHLATRPVSPTVRNPAVPAVLSDIVLKLLAKMPEERYQSAEGLEVDLRSAQRQWRETGAIRPFLLGREDLVRELPIPDKLFGREREWSALTSALQAAVRGEKRVVFVRGAAGVGKSALVEKLEPSVEEQGGRFAPGKCDQLRANMPMAPFVQALGSAIAGLLALPARARAQWGLRIESAFEGSGRLLTELLPELEQLVGSQPPTEQLGAAETRRRLFSLLSALVRVLSENGALVLFLDDLQWADASTLELLAHLAADEQVGHLLLIAAYRDGCADPALEAGLAATRESGAALAELELGPLDLGAVTALLVETLRSTPEYTAPLAQMVHGKTGGNPLFISRLLRFLWQNKLLWYDRRAESYAWNRARIAELPVTENVADLLIAGMNRLPERTRRLLEFASCIGTRFDLRELAEVTGQAYEDAGQALWSALQEGFLVLLEEPPLRAAEGREGPLPAVGYRFAHDRIHEAVYAMLPEPERRACHLRIGRALSRRSAEAVDRRIFEIVDQINHGLDEMLAAERLQLAELNLRAGRRAKRSAAYGAALAYLCRGLSVLTDDAVHTHHALWFELHRDAAECAYLSGDHPRCKALIDTALAHVANELEFAALSGILMLGTTAQGRYAEAIAIGFEALRRLRIDPPASDVAAAVEWEFARVDATLAGRRAPDLLALPPMTDPYALASLRLVSQAMSAAFTLDQRVFAWLSLRAMRLCLEHGRSVSMARACADYGVILTVRGRYAAAHDFGRLAIALAASTGSRAEESRALFIVASTIDPWTDPLRATVPNLRSAFAHAVASGEFQIAGLAAALRIQLLFACGAPLDAVLGELEQCQAFVHKAAHRSAIDLIVPYRQALRVLKGHVGSASRLEDQEFQEAPYLAQASGVIVLCYATVRMQVAYLMGEIALAEEMCELAARHLKTMGGAVVNADFHFYAALTLAARMQDSDLRERPQLLARFADSQHRLERWAESCPANFHHKLLIVRAERARLDGRDLEAAQLFEQAIVAAEREGFLQDEALARELYGRLALLHGLRQSAATHLSAALRGYIAWGAMAKARVLEAECAAIGIPTFDRRPPLRMPTRTDGPSVLEIGGLLEAAETLTAELVLPRLLEKLLHLSLELAGAERGVLVVNEAAGAVVRATGTALGVSLEQTPLAASEELPRSIAEHVLRTAHPVVLGDAVDEGGFGSDAYLSEHRVKSVLAMPVRRAARSAGVLYLENNLATEVFTPERVQTLELLSGQIGAALDNALLVRQLENEVAERKEKEAQARFLADASAAFAESLDYETTLDRAVRLVVPGMADMCIVDVVEGNEIRPVATVHTDPEKEAVLREMRRRYPVDWSSPHPASQVLRSGRSQLLAEITHETRRQYSLDTEHARLAGELGMRSAMVVPLIARGRTLGAITLASQRALRHRESDLPLAEEFARRAALAIDNARLYRQSEDAVRARDEFLSIASHELRTPVAALQLTVEAVSKGLLTATPAMLQRSCQLVTRQVTRLAQLIEQLLSVSRIEAGRMVLQPENVDLTAVVQNAVWRLDAMIARSESQVFVHAGGPVMGCWDTSALEQVVTNLLTNAIKFGQRNPITITVEREDATARLIVSDRGIGIPEDRLPHIFERFERAVSAREYGGLGLGLFIVYSIVEVLGGCVRVESRRGEGSTFTVELPCTGPNRGEP